MEISIIGAGVSGLSTGIRLLEAGCSVVIFADKSSPDTVSDTAAAWWYPFLVEPLEKTNRWSAETFTELVRLTEEEGLSSEILYISDDLKFDKDLSKTFAISST